MAGNFAGKDNRESLWFVVYRFVRLMEI